MTLLSELETAELSHAYRSGCPGLKSLQPELRNVFEQLLGMPGGFIRGQLAVRVALNCGFPKKYALAVAVGLEYFHLSSLVLDDLPCMDDAVTRRGLPCVHRQFGEAAAILSSLGLINRSHALLWSAISTVQDESLRDEAGSLVEACIGIHGILNGQAMDLAFTSAGSDRDVTKVALGKTASLFRLTILLPALLSRVSRQELHQLDRLAVLLGLSYQLVDDFKDVRSKGYYSGKTPRDQILCRPNMVLQTGAEASKARLEHLFTLSEKFIVRLERNQIDWGFFRRVVSKLRTESNRLSIEQANVEDSAAVS